MNIKKIVIRVLCVCIPLVIFFFGSIFSESASSKSFWPPKLNAKYPAMEFIDQTGSKIRISDFKGSVILIEYVGMNCPACQAFSGANTKVGPYQNNAVQKGVKSFEEICPIYAKGIKLSDPRITYIQILLYDLKMGAPTPEDARKWAKHFGFEKGKKQYVSVPTKDLRGDASYNLIPGFQLVDKNLILRSDSTGHHPRHSLWNKLLPMISEVMEE